MTAYYIFYLCSSCKGKLVRGQQSSTEATSFPSCSSVVTSKCSTQVKLLSFLFTLSLAVYIELLSFYVYFVSLNYKCNKLSPMAI